MEPVQGRTILLTGASSGIGRETARLLGQQGARLALVARRREKLDEITDEIAAAGAPRPAVIAADLGERGIAATVAERALAELGHVDVLVNNAGASVQGLTWIAADRDEARDVFETNLWAPLALAAALAPAMIERGSGTIVNTGSMARVSPFPHLGHYSASRAALSVATQTMRMELGPLGIRVVELALGPIDTAGSHENRRLTGADAWLDGRPGLGKLERAAAALVQAIEGPADGVVFYPSMLRWVDRLPALGRRYSRRAARAADLDDRAIRVGGSAGDPELVASRDRWEHGGEVATEIADAQHSHA